MSQLKPICGQLFVTAASEPSTLAASWCSVNTHWWAARANSAQVHSNFITKAHLYENLSPANIWDVLRLNYYLMFI